MRAYKGITQGKESALRQMSEAQKGYIAGILDGEGHLYIRGHYEGTSYSRIRVRMCDKSVISYLAKTTRVGTVTSYIPNGRRKDGGPKRVIYEWTLGKRLDARDFLLAVMPHLIVKKRHAQLLLELESLKAQGSLGHEDVQWLKSEISKRNFHK